MSNKRSTGVNVGGSSILVIFILLCLTTFATLSMVSANADLKLTEKSALATENYYIADAQAEQMLADIDSYLHVQRSAASDTNSFFTACISGIPGVVEGTTAETVSGSTLLVKYNVPVGDTHQLAVELKVTSTSSQDVQITRNTWQVQSITDWQPGSEGLNLWGGEPVLGDGLPPI